VLRAGGIYFAQHVGPASAFELVEHFLGPQPQARRSATDTTPGIHMTEVVTVGLTERVTCRHFTQEVIHLLRSEAVWRYQLH
jgi:hypothetical protein